MDKERITVVLYLMQQGRRVDVDIPVDITANELIIGLNAAYQLGMDTSDLFKCYLRTENPIAFLRGNKKITEYGLRNGTVVNFINQEDGDGRGTI